LFGFTRPFGNFAQNDREHKVKLRQRRDRRIYCQQFLQTPLKCFGK